MSIQLKVIIFLAVAAGLGWLSRSSLRSLQAHGFYRFFAWITIVGLVLLNVEHWFREPFSARQIVSWILLIISVLMLIHGVHLLRMAGKPDRRRTDPLLMGIEKTTRLVTVGAYRYVRHPIYSSGLYGVWGIFLKHPSSVGILLAVLTALFLTITARREEAENIRFFGTAYQSYMKKTKMFIPFLF